MFGVGDFSLETKVMYFLPVFELMSDNHQTE